jgi:hypothetical protein
MKAQGEFDFDAGGAGEGYAGWLAGRKLASVEVARRLHLPIEHAVEVWLKEGVPKVKWSPLDSIG